MAHGDDRGLRIPPKMAPIEAVLMPIVRSNDDRAIEACRALAETLAARQASACGWTRATSSPAGSTASGTCAAFRCASKSARATLTRERAVLARRDRSKGDPDQRQSVALDERPACSRAARGHPGSLYPQAKAFLEAHTFAATDRDEFLELCRERAGMVDIAWCERPECEADVKRSQRRPRGRASARSSRHSICIACGEPARARAYFAQSY